MSDLRQAVRAMLKDRSCVPLVIVNLALGMATFSTGFSVLNGVLLKPLPYREPSRVVTLLRGGSNPVSAADFQDWREHSPHFEAIAVAETWGVILTENQDIENLSGMRVSEEWFDVFGVQPVMGRAFRTGDYQADSDRIVILSDRLWERHFGGGMGGEAHSVVLNGETYTVVGVMPRSFRIPAFGASESDIWIPWVPSREQVPRRSGVLRVFARLRPDVSLEQVREDTAALDRKAANVDPGTGRGPATHVDTMLEMVTGGMRGPLWWIFGATAVVFGMACFNAAALLLDRTAFLRKESAIRAVLGATHRHQMITSLVSGLFLAGIASAMGLLVTCGEIEWLKAWLGGEGALVRSRLVRWQEIGVDASVVLFHLSLTVFCSLMVGFVPPMGSRREKLRTALAGDGPRITLRRRGAGWRSLLIVVESALLVICALGAIWMSRGWLRLSEIKPGFDPRNVLTLGISLASQPELVGERRNEFYRTLIGRIEGLTGVVSASAVSHLPLIGDLWGFELSIEGRPWPPPGEGIGAIYRVCQPGYFATLGQKLVRGRDFNLQDDAEAPRVAIVNRRFVQQHGRGDDLIGKRITFDYPRNDPRWMTIVGMVDDARQKNWSEDIVDEVYVPFAQSPFISASNGPASTMSLVVRTRMNPRESSAAIQRKVLELNPRAAISRMTTLEAIVADALWKPRMGLVLFVQAAAMLITFASTSIYVAARHRVLWQSDEVIIRWVLGARRRWIWGRIVGRCVILAILGGSLGIGSAILVVHFVRPLPFGVSARDPLGFAIALVLMGIAALVASYFPARRAAFEPRGLLRCE